MRPPSEQTVRLLGKLDADVRDRILANVRARLIAQHGGQGRCTTNGEPDGAYVRWRIVWEATPPARRRAPRATGWSAGAEYAAGA